MTEPPLPDLGAKHLVISLGEGFLGKDDTPSRALLITDPYDIRKLYASIIALEPIVCTCGFPYSASFWASPFEVVAGFTIGPARYDRQLLSRFDQLWNRPTHFIYDLTIPVDIHPEQVIDNLEERGLTAFLMDKANPDLAFYRVQLVVDEPDLETIRQKLACELPYVIDVSKRNPNSYVGRSAL